MNPAFPIKTLLLLLILALPAAVRAQFTYTASNSEITITHYTDWGVFEAVVPGTIDGLPVTGIANDAFSGSTILTSIAIPASVTDIGDSAFFPASNLTAILVDALNPNYSSVDGVLFNKSQTRLIQYPVGKTDFNYTIPSGVTSVGADAFRYCPNLTAILVDPLNSSYSSVDGVLFDKSQTLLVQYPRGKTDFSDYTIPNTVIRVGEGAFFANFSLTSVIIPNGVIEIGDRAFDNCSLNGIEIPTSVNRIGSEAFAYSSLVGVTIPRSVTIIGDSAFASCPGLDSIIVDPLNPSYSSVDGILFNKSQTLLIQYGRNSLESYVIPDGVTRIGAKAFFENDLSDITIPDTVTNIGNAAFRLCRVLGHATIPESVTTIEDDAFSQSGLYNVSIPNSVVRIGVSAFDFCDRLTNVTMGASVASVGNQAFEGCTSLPAIDVDSLNAAYRNVNGVLFNKDQTRLISYPGGKAGGFAIPNTVTGIGDYAFSYGRLTSVTIPNTVSFIGDGAFNNCRSLTGVTLPAGLTRIGNDAFSSVNLTKISIPNSVTSIGENAFSLCPSLTNVSLPNGLASISYGLFSYCNQLAGVAIPNSVSTIGGFAFNRCLKLTSVTIPDSVTNIGYLAFNQCLRLTSITLGHGVKNIGAAAFYQCGLLTNLTIPRSVTSLEAFSFSNCKVLAGAYFEGDVPNVVSSAFVDSTIATAYYLPGKAGWSSSLAGRPAVLWNPQAPTSDPNFGIHAGQFGFTITGTAGIVVVVEASPDLSNPVWSPISTKTLTGGSAYFSDPDWASHPTRTYRFRSP